jgi:uncharacterized membrane protein
VQPLLSLIGAARVAHFWDTLRGSLWFIPGLMATAAVLLALLMLYLDDVWVPRWAVESGWIYSRSPGGARDLLSTVASSMITVAGLTFSIVIVALQLASSQFGPRVLRNYMRDRGSQAVLGTFIATFLYCLMVMRTISDADRDEPRLAVTLAVVLAVASLAVLIYFLHHSAASIHAPNVVATISHELAAGIDRMYPATVGASPGAVVTPTDSADTVHVLAERAGYVQSIDGDALIQLAKDEDLLIRVVQRPGDFVWPRDALLAISPSARASDSVRARARGSVILGDQRTGHQDIVFGFEQLVQVTLRALSPAYNDPLTAVGCIEHLGAALDRLLQRPEPPAVRLDHAGRARVVAPPVPTARIMDLMLTPIIESSRDATLVLRQLAITVEALSAQAHRQDIRQVLAGQAQLIARHADQVGTPTLRGEMREYCERALARLARE